MSFDLSSNSIEILSDRESIRSQLIDYAKTYLELENVDLYKTSFLSYVINVMSMLAANQLYYTSSIYREFFITEAQMIESVYNLSKWIGYTPMTATPATADIMLILPFSFQDDDVQFLIPNDFKVKSDDIIYTIGTQELASELTVKVDTPALNQLIEDQLDSGTVVRAYQNKSLTVRNNATGYFYPVAIDTESETASVLIPFTQYTTSIQEKHVPDDLEHYQFWSMEVEFEGMDWKVEVYRESASGIYSFDDIESKYDKLEQAENNSIYTMTSTEEKYVWISTLNKGEILFGNGIIGQQPEAGLNIVVIIYVTKGLSGRVISNSLTTPDSLYYTGSVDNTGQVKNWKVKLSTTNPEAAIGGSDSPTISEIKSGAIANLRSKQRLVSDTDYDDFEYIITDTPLSDTKPILKRSDLKINEIEVFSKLIYDDGIVPTRNVSLEVPTTTTIIPDGTEYEIDEENYKTIFTMSLNHNTSEAIYEYIIRNVSVTAVQETTSEYAQFCYIILTNVNFLRIGNTVKITATVTNIEDKIATGSFDCEIMTSWNSSIYNMTAQYDSETIPNLTGFDHTLNDYLDIPVGNHKITFNIFGEVPNENLPTNEQTGDPLHVVRKPISTYSLFITIRKDLSSIMRSSIIDHPPNKVHNVPVILSQYLTGIDQSLFEAKVLQLYVNNIEMNDKKMLTDFTNIKFCNTTGRLSNMKLNTPNITSVETISRTSIPLNPADGYRVIANGTEDTSWVQYKDKIGEWDDTSSTWDWRTPSINDMIYIADDAKKLVWSGSEWFYPEFGIPFDIEATITRSPVVGISLVALVNNIKTALIDYFTPIFGLDKNIDRSEIIKVIRGVDGVIYAQLKKPEIDIKFTYKIADLDQDTLLDYTPELVVFSNENITIHVVNE